ncbi:hypothetical protein AVEN_75901-1 [Araneus ventricosus]|uniref:Uncharacterized protein n=1 Tax=Araneus ventricosus TaxID=182803 RepID=A0A4Y2FUG1_ARAVE|nr:hypothetical protein AVEN_75901-1 [Araneus ventricosus]
MFTNPKASPSSPKQTNGTSAESPRMSTTLCSDSNVETPVSKQKPLRTSNNGIGDEIKRSNTDAREFSHEKLDFLKKEYIRDKENRPPSSSNYNPSTLYVPDDFKKKLTPEKKRSTSIKTALVKKQRSKVSYQLTSLLADQNPTELFLA